jgi:hypothetical protein
LTLNPEKGTVSVNVASGQSVSWRVPTLGAALVGALLLLNSPPALAKNPTPQQIKTAAEEFDRGVKAAQAGNFDEAAAHFEAADREAPSPDALKAAIRARRDAKQGARAATLAALALARHASNQDLAAFAKGVLDQFSSGLHKVAVSCDPDCLLVVDNKLVPAEAAAKITLYLDPGPHAVAAGWGEKTQSKEITASAGGSSALSFSPPKDAPPPASAPSAAPPPGTSAELSSANPPKGGLPPAVAYVGIGLTVALGGASLWSGLDAQSNPGPDKVKEKCVGLGESCPEYKDGLSRQRRTNILLAATGGTAVLTVAVAAFLTNWSGSSSPASARTPRLVPGVSFDTTGATLHAAGRF